MSETQELDSKIIKGLSNLRNHDKIKLIKVMGGFNHGVSSDENRLLNSFSALISGKNNKGTKNSEGTKINEKSGLQNLIGGFFNSMLPDFLVKKSKSNKGGAVKELEKDPIQELTNKINNLEKSIL